MIDDQSEPGSWARALRKPKQTERFMVALPFPPAKLSRNGSQGDYRGKASAAKDYRKDCLIACSEAIGTVDWCPDLPVMLDMTFHAHDKRHRDLDNLLAMTKQGVDAISEYLGIDDKHFEFTIRRGEVRKPSVVVVTI